MALAGLTLAGCLVSPDPGLWQRRTDAAPPDRSVDAPAGDQALDSAVYLDSVGPGVITIYRSVGPGSTAPLAQGSSTASLTVSGVVASFGQALPARAGVGDALTYDADGDGDIDGADGLAFIHRRYSASSYEVRTARGAAPAAVAKASVWSLHRAYSSIADALRGDENSGIAQGLRDFDTWSNGTDLVTPNLRWAIACYADAKETMPFKISGWTTSPKNHLRIFAPSKPDEVGASQRHSGKAGTGFVIDTGTAAHAITIESSEVWLEGLEVTGWLNDTANASWEGIHVAADGALIDGMIIHDDTVVGTTNPNGDAISLNDLQAGQVVTVRNCAIYNISRGAVNYQGSEALLVNIESCTIHNTGTSLAQADSQGGISIAGTAATVSVVNTISVGSGSGEDFKSGSGFGGSSNNLSSDDSAPGSGSLTQTLGADLFVSTTAGSEDLHLVSGAAAVGQGKDLSKSFDLDIDNEVRSAPWDIGADER